MRSEEVVIVKKIRREKGRDARLLAVRQWCATFFCVFFLWLGFWKSLIYLSGFIN